MFERFSDKAMKVMFLAQEECRDFGRNCLEPEHILLGLIKEGTGFASKAFRSIGIPLRETREALQKHSPGAPPIPMPENWQMSDATKEFLSRVWDECKSLGTPFICTEHFLLALLENRDGRLTS